MESTFVAAEEAFENSMRPRRMDDFCGQVQLVKNMNVFIEAARRRREPLDHILFHGPPGLGKTTLSRIVAEELDVNIKETSGPVLEKPGDLAGVLTSLEKNDVLFIDEIHRLSPVVEEYLYSAMEDYKIDILLDSGANARTVSIGLQPFTLIGATTRVGLLTSPLQSRFGIKFRLEYYTEAMIIKILTRSAQLMQLSLHAEAAAQIARRSRGTPRVANALLRRVRDFAEVLNKGVADVTVSRKALEAMAVDEYGLDEMDNKILLTIMDKFKGGPVGLHTLAVAVGEEADTIEEVNEPFLIQQGFLERTPRGRQVTERAYTHLQRQKPSHRSVRNLFDNVDL